MPAKIAVIISPNWRDYAEKYLADCLKSLAAQDLRQDFKVFLIDNESSPASRELLNDLIQTHCPSREYSLIVNQRNSGFAGPNSSAIKLALSEGYDYLALFNIDTIINRDCLRLLLAAAETDQNIGAVQARIMLWPEKNKINSLGNTTHFLGFGYSEGYARTLDFSLPPLKDIIYPSGAAVLFRAAALHQVGLFDEEFWMYNEDQDLGWRLNLAGWRSVLAGDAVVYHKYKFFSSAKNYYWPDRNRLLTIFKNYRLPTLLLIAPALLIMEIGLWLFAARTGWLKERLKVYQYFLRPATWAYLIRARRASQALRVVSDRKATRQFSAKIVYPEIDGIWLRLANLVLGFYWSVVKNFILW